MQKPDSNSVFIWDEAQGAWLLFENPVAICQADQTADIESVLHAIEQHVREGRFAAGWLSYEAAPAFDSALTVHQSDAFPLLWFGIYEDVTTLPAIEISNAESRRQSAWHSSITEDEYAEAIRVVRAYIAQGDTYQVNFSYRLSSALQGDAWELFQYLLDPKDACYGAYINTPDYEIYSASPELFFQLDGDHLVSRPMKGTAARGMTWEADLEQAEWLQQSEKNRAENVMIVDMVRNDMGRIAKPGTVAVDSLFAVEKYSTLWQMTSTVSCTTDLSVTDILKALFPAASITGAPKCRTMQIIKELETTPRKIYTGSMGYIAPDRKALFNVSIRTLLIDKSTAKMEYGVGGGIVWDSEDISEQDECNTKARILLSPQPDFCLLETLLWNAESGYFLKDYHLDRLKKSAAYFSINVSEADVCKQLQEVVSTLKEDSAYRVRLLVNKGGGIQTEVYPLKSSEEKQGLRIILNDEPIHSSDPFLYHKTTNRKMYEQPRERFPDYDDVLLWNEHGEITESCVANVLVELGDQLYTPPVKCGLLAGTLRADMLAKGEITERVITKSDLQQASKIYLINSVRKRQLVIRLGTLKL